MINDQFGIVTEQAQRRAIWGNRRAHGKVRDDGPPIDPIATRLGLIRPRRRRALAVPPKREMPRAQPLPPAPIPEGITPATALHIAEIVTGIPIPEMKGAGQVYPMAQARGFAIWLIRTRCNMSYMKISHLFLKDHTSILAAVRKMEWRLARAMAPFTTWRDQADGIISTSQREHSVHEGKLTP